MDFFVCINYWVVLDFFVRWNRGKGRIKCCVRILCVAYFLEMKFFFFVVVEYISFYVYSLYSIFNIFKIFIFYYVLNCVSYFWSERYD